MFHSLKARYQTAREDGFTLTELVVAILILGILLAIALPVFLNAQKHVSSLDVKTGLIQAASLIEAEKGDNNQLYPVYMPTEILSDSLWKTFAYTYSDDRLSYCLQGRDSDGGKWWVGSASRTPSSLNCGQANVAKNSETPWQIVFPAVDVSTYSIEWKANASNPNGSVTWVDAQCNEGTTSYQLHIVNNSQGIDTKVPTDTQIKANNAGLTTNSYAPDLGGWLPDDQTTVSVAAVCTVSTGGRLYTFPAGSSTGKSMNKNVPQFPVVAASYTSAPAAYYVENADKSLTMKVDVAFTPLTSCPTLTSGINGTNHPVYELIAKQSGKSDVGKGTFSTSPSLTQTLSAFAPDTTITYEGRSYCEFTRTSGSVSRYSGNDVNDTKNDGHATSSEYSPVGFPTAPGTPTTVSSNSGSVKPDGLTWTAPQNRSAGSVCAYGGTVEYSYVQSSPGSSASVYSSATASGLVNWAQATTYKYYVNAKCRGANRTSDVTPSGTLTFTTSALTPAASWRTQYSTSYSSGQLLASGSLNTITCPNNSAVRYFVKASQSGENDVTYDGTDSSPTLTLNTNNNSNNGYDGDKSVNYSGYGYCRVTQYDNSTRDWPGTAATSSEYAAVAKPAGTSTPYTYTSGNPEVIDNVLQWDGQSCLNGGSIRYRYVQDSPGNSTSDWQTGTNTVINWGANTRYYYHIEYYCDGSQGRDSDYISGGQTTFVTQNNRPNAPSAPTSVQLNNDGYANVTDADRLLWAGVNCGRSSTAYYIVRQVRSGGNYRGPDNPFQATDWFTNTYFDFPASWLRQGSQQGYQVIAQCRNTYTSDNSGWSGEAYWTHNIDQPGAPGNVRRNGDRELDWDGVGCGWNATPEYYFQQYNHNDNTYSSVESGWRQNYYAQFVDGFNGYSQYMRVYSHCVGDNATSGQSVSGNIGWQIPVYGPSSYFVCKPGSTASGKASSGNVSYCNNTGSANYKKQVAFTLTCGNNNPYWNGGTAWDSNAGIYVNTASGLSATQKTNGRNTGDGTFGATGSATNNAANGYTWGSNYNVSANNAYCYAGNGAQSGRVSRTIDINTGLDN